MFRTIVQNSCSESHVDIAVVGGGLAGLATALRLQADGVSTAVFEAHGHVGGCAGYWRHRQFSFDVGATTLVDFEPGGVGAELLDAVGMAPVRGEALPGYVAWLPDRVVTLYRDPAAWHAERLRAFGDDQRHRELWQTLDRLAAVFWAASRAGVRLPIRRTADIVHNVLSVGLGNTPLAARYLTRTMGDVLRQHGLEHDTPLRALLGMLVEDTVHSTVERAPAINAALGITIRGAGLTRHDGGMHGFWRTLVTRYRDLGGQLWTGTAVSRVDGARGRFRVVSRRGELSADQVVLAVPAPNAAAITAGLPLARRLERYLRRDRGDLGGAVLVVLGVPEQEVAGLGVPEWEVAGLGVPEQEVAGPTFTHHQLLQDYEQPYGDGNNMFVSVSAPDDRLSAPAGHRAVMISTHTELSTWEELESDEYVQRKKEIGERLVGYARRVYPALGDRAVVMDVGTPRTYERFANRPHGAVGGPHQRLGNSNQFAIPHDLGGPGLWLVGDSTWPGLGTVACVLGSRIVADGIRRERRRR
jgi:C-3',4' desaturase CrtD